MTPTVTHHSDGTTLNGEPVEPTQTGGRSSRTLSWRKVLGVAAFALASVLIVPREAIAQFGDIFSAIFSSIQNDMGVSLKAINQVTQDTKELYQVTMWPLAAINQARGFASTAISGYRNAMNLTFTTPINSATLPATQQFETILRSQQSSQIGALQQNFTTNFGAIPQVNGASSQDRVLMDIDDALAQENLKTTLISDQAGNTLLTTANTMENQVALSTPGSNPFLTAQSQVAVLRSQAFLQKLLAAELRQEAGRIAHDNVLVKRKTSVTSNINSLITGALQAR